MPHIYFVLSVRQGAYLLYENLSATGAASASAGVLPALQAKLSLRYGKKPAKTDTSVFEFHALCTDNMG